MIRVIGWSEFQVTKIIGIAHTCSMLISIRKYSDHSVYLNSSSARVNALMFYWSLGPAV